MRFCKNLGIRKTCSTPYYPQGDGVIERLFRTIKPMLGIVKEEQEMEWDQAIPIVELGLRNKKNAITGLSPNDILFGKNILALKTRSNHNADFVGRNKSNNTVEDYVKALERNLDNIQRKLYRDIPLINRNNTNSKFKVGEFVLVRRIGTRSGSVLFDGPYRVTRIIGKNAFELQDNHCNKIQRNVIYLKNTTEKSVHNFRQMIRQFRQPRRAV